MPTAAAIPIRSSRSRSARRCRRACEDWQATPARNHVNVLTADAIIALPGGVGTANELDMAAEYRDERGRPRAERRTILVGPADEFEPPASRAVRACRRRSAKPKQHLRRVLAARGFALELRAAQ